MSTSEEQIIKDVQIVCKQAIELGQHLELTIRGVIQKLIDEMKHDEDFVYSKPIKKIIKNTAAECLQPIDELGANPTNEESIKPRELAVQPAESTTQDDSADQPTEAISANQPEEKNTEEDIARHLEETTTKEDLADQTEGVDTTDDLANQSAEKMTREDSADVINGDSADQPEAKTTNKDSANQPEEQDDLANQPEGKPVKKNSPSSRPASKKKGRTSSKGAFKSAETVDSDGNSVHENEVSTSKVVDQPTLKPKAKRGRKPKVEDISEQELTKKPNVNDDPNKEDDKPGCSPQAKKTGKGKKAAVPVDKDEERIKKLKGFVVACGVRKQWKREFATCKTNKEQIERLTKILDGLGMTGRLSMAKAKEIKARRDLEAEVNELAPPPGTDSSGDDDDDDGEGNDKEGGEGHDGNTQDDDEKKPVIKKRKKNCTASSGDESSDAPNRPNKKKNPFAFLGNQDSEDSS
ncbi:hypothetical protein PSHT_10531 [Puccinia striiformis]|uniref:Uncharacterized protein n=1 Tax=Puccinia striiformis TaxID=27350 RepID=A0A2S4V921_9BASI|nr:hypothetical protein PSHT_10531 [Puccinia striiformis]